MIKEEKILQIFFWGSETFFVTKIKQNYSKLIEALDKVLNLVSH